MGRPLPYGDPRGVEPVPEEPLPADETLVLAQSLLDSGRAFAAHEVLEAAWKAAPVVRAAAGSAGAGAPTQRRFRQVPRVRRRDERPPGH
jgi:hypothetical protein